MSIFLVEPNYFKGRYVVEAGSTHEARCKTAKWLRRNKHIRINPYEFEVQKVYHDALKIKDAVRIL